MKYLITKFDNMDIDLVIISNLKNYGKVCNVDNSFIVFDTDLPFLEVEKFFNNDYKIREYRMSNDFRHGTRSSCFAC